MSLKWRGQKVILLLSVDYHHLPLSQSVSQPLTAVFASGGIVKQTIPVYVPSSQYSEWDSWCCSFADDGPPHHIIERRGKEQEDPCFGRGSNWSRRKLSCRTIGLASRNRWCTKLIPIALSRQTVTPCLVIRDIFVTHSSPVECLWFDLRWEGTGWPGQAFALNHDPRTRRDIIIYT